MLAIIKLFIFVVLGIELVELFSESGCWGLNPSPHLHAKLMSASDLHPYEVVFFFFSLCFFFLDKLAFVPF